MRFNAAIADLPQMMAFIQKEAEKHRVDSKTEHKVELVCEEILVNVINYSGAGDVEIECQKEGQRFNVFIIDHGKPFNPIDAAIDPQFGTPLTDRKIGGLGIHLMRQIAGEAMYRREGQDNVLRLGFTPE